jgi:transposase InsO family protein
VLGQRRLRELVATLKNELIYTRPWPTLTGLKKATFEFIEAWYNTHRHHSSLGYRSPAEYEATIYQETAARAA